MQFLREDHWHLPKQVHLDHHQASLPKREQLQLQMQLLLGNHQFQGLHQTETFLQGNLLRNNWTQKNHITVSVQQQMLSKKTKTAEKHQVRSKTRQIWRRIQVITPFLKKRQLKTSKRKKTMKLCNSRIATTRLMLMMNQENKMVLLPTNQMPKKAQMERNLKNQCKCKIRTNLKNMVEMMMKTTVTILRFKRS